MKNKIYLMIAVSMLAITFNGCSISSDTGSDSETKPTKTDSAEIKETDSTKKTEKPKAVLKGDKKPEGESKALKKDNPVPADWIYYYNERMGYGFSIPEGTTGEYDGSGGTDYFGMTTPSGIDIFVLAYKDKTLSKEDLLDDAVEFLESLGQKVTPGNLHGDSEDYAVADADTVLADGREGKLRILVGTDVTDNYIMILGTDPNEYAANEKIIDEIWGSFEMWSGGSSGVN